MQELARYALPGQNYNESKAAEYYSVKNKRDELRRKINDSLAARVKNKQEIATVCLLFAKNNANLEN